MMFHLYDPLCVCGHSRDNHADPTSGDTAA